MPVWCIAFLSAQGYETNPNDPEQITIRCQYSAIDTDSNWSGDDTAQVTLTTGMTASQIERACRDAVKERISQALRTLEDKRFFMHAVSRG